MGGNTLILLLIVIFVIVWVLIKMGSFQGVTGGRNFFSGGNLGSEDNITDYIQDEVTGGKDAEGFVYIEDKELDKLNVKGAAVVKKTIITGDLTSHGSLEIRGESEVQGKTTSVGKFQASGCKFGNMNLLGSSDLYKSNAEKVTVCGKLHAKGSTFKEIIIDPKCDMTEVRMPYITLKDCQVTTITYPKDMEEAIKSQAVLIKNK